MTAHLDKLKRTFVDLLTLVEAGRPLETLYKDCLTSTLRIFRNLDWSRAVQPLADPDDVTLQRIPWAVCEVRRLGDVGAGVGDCAGTPEALAESMKACSRCMSVRYCSVGSFRDIFPGLLCVADADSAVSASCPRSPPETRLEATQARVQESALGYRWMRTPDLGSVCHAHSRSWRDLSLQAPSCWHRRG